MKNLDDSLTEIDWLNTLRIKSAKEFKDGITTCVNNDWSNEAYSRIKYSEYSKPSYSYAYLIKLAIESSKSNKMKLSEIYEWIMDKYPYYKYMKTDNGKGWKNAIRHNLSLNKFFKRYPKNRSEPGKGSYWTIDSNCEENQIHDPPIKRLKLFNLITPKDAIQNVKNKEKISPANIPSSEINVIKHSSNNDLDLDHNNSSNTSCTEFITTKKAFPINSLIFHDDHKIDIFTNSFSDQSAFVPYSIQNNHICKISEISSSACEISYKKDGDMSTERLPKMLLTDISKSGNNATEHSFPECETITSSNVDLDPHDSTNTSISQFIYTKRDFPTNPSILLDKRSDIFANSFSDQSAFVPYSIHNNICKIAEISSSTCEISYPRNLKYSHSFLQTPKMTYSNYSSRNFSKGYGLLLPKLHEGSCDPFDLSELSSRSKPSTGLEIDSVGFGNGKNDIILKTPVLSQISGGSDFKDKTEESLTIKFPKMLQGFKDDGVEAIFENSNLHDSFLSFHRSFFDSETFDSRHVFPSAYTEKGASLSQNLLLSTMSQYNINEVKNINQNLFEGSFGLSTSASNILLNMSGLKENWSSSSQWIELNDSNRDLDLSNDIQSGIIPSQDFLEMKNHLRCHRFKNDSITESYKPSSVSTTSTLKSTDTLHSKSPAWDKKADAINSKDVTVVIDQVSKSHLSEEDDIEDCFNWDSFI